MKNQLKAKPQPNIEKRPVDVVLDEYNSFHTNPTNRLISYLSIPLVSFGILAFIWSIPFPHFDFLGKYNGFINWASFLIAGMIYYYLRLSPLMSYAVLFVLAAFSYLIVSLEKTVVLAQIGLFFGILGSVAQLIGYNKEGRRPLFAQDLKFMAIGPMWLFSLLFKKLNLRY
ncbi:Mpo1 family 2-hydroxy fatty acid dioxygenase [Mucilaginibacter auburnensis]|uniref:Putative membrane protein YGL010W n=1 Tax=Mucilaginibacter auburnensis TaxID=1457233 RepID=A0A2H9VPA3_9SPHI|nr:Mpo1-like protein [Mucilaginibacter auburnensis]PJJ80147.1 putative membrane protein YGL010W [Mucilaginibacter auburnensis]